MPTAMQTITIIVLAVLAAAIGAIYHYRRGLKFVLSYLGAIKIGDNDVLLKKSQHTWKNGQTGRIFEFVPANKKPSSVIIFVTGISRDGLDDERLAKLARSLAFSGKVALLAEFNDFAAYKIKGSESDKLVEAVALVKQKYPKLPYGIGAVCLGGVVTLLSLTKLSNDRLPKYIYLHGVFLDHDEMVKHCSKATPAEDKPPLSYETLPPDPLGKAAILYNSENFLGTLKDRAKCEEILKRYLSTVKDSDSHIEFRHHMKSLHSEDFDRVIGRVEPEILSDIDESSPVKFFDGFDFPKNVKIFQSHTRDDDVIPLQQGIDLFNFLKSRGAQVTFVTSDVGHGGEVRGILGQLKFFKFTLDWANH